MEIQFALSESAVATDINRSRINSPESNGEFEDLSEFTALEKKLREHEENKAKQKMAKQAAETVNEDEESGEESDEEDFDTGDDGFDDSDFED